MARDPQNPNPPKPGTDTEILGPDGKPVDEPGGGPIPKNEDQTFQPSDLDANDPRRTHVEHPDELGDRDLGTAAGDENFTSGDDDDESGEYDEDDDDLDDEFDEELDEDDEEA